MPTPTKDPVEQIIEDALDGIGMPYEREREIPGTVLRIDFYLPTFDIYIECKQFHTDRTNEQMAAVKNIIVIQGMEAAYVFRCMIKASDNGYKHRSQR